MLITVVIIGGIILVYTCLKLSARPVMRELSIPENQESDGV